MGISAEASEVKVWRTLSSEISSDFYAVDNDIADCDGLAVRFLVFVWTLLPFESCIKLRNCFRKCHMANVAGVLSIC